MADEAPLNYRKLFDPELHAAGALSAQETAADRAPPQTYLFDDSLVLAINIALATGRPLLLRGASGVGKTSVARAIAWRQGWSFVSIVVTSRTLARDFLYHMDELKRLRDAYAKDRIDDLTQYLSPGPLFWAFNPDYARSILNTNGQGRVPTGIVDNAENTVVLIDEIDKADPDVPNNLLEPLGHLSFEAPELPRPVIAPENRIPLVILTTNEERDLPAAFLRRCVEHRIGNPNPEWLRRIGEAHFGHDFNAVHHNILVNLQPGSPAAYLDGLRACARLGKTDTNLEKIAESVLGPARKGPAL